MGFQLSPGVRTSEIDLSTVVTGTASTGGVLAGPATWGPAGVRTLIDSETLYVDTFGKPTNATANTFFTAANFLQYGDNLNFVRVLSAAARNASTKGTSLSTITITNGGSGYSSVPTISFTGGGGGTGAAATAVLTGGVLTSVTMSNAGTGYTSNPTVVLTGGTPTLGATLVAHTGLVIPNSDVYQTAFADGESTLGQWAAKYAGVFGNNLAVSIADAGNFGTWAYAALFNGAPGTSDYVAGFNGSNDELHVAVIDVTGVISGTPGEVIERYAYVSKASDAKTPLGESNYYVNQINRKSSYISWLGHPVTTNSNWGALSAGAAFDVLSSVVVLASSGQTGNYVAGETVNVFSGSVASITATGGSGYTTAPTVAISAPNVVGGSQATATAVVATGAITGFTVTNAGSGYTNTPTVTLTPTNGGTGGAGVAVVAYSGLPLRSATVSTWNSGTRTLNLLVTKGTFVANDKLVGATSAATGSVQTNVDFVNTLTLIGGVDGNDTITDGNIIGGYDLFNVEDFDLALILAADNSATVTDYLITDIAETRQDCVVCLSPPKAAVVNNVGNEVTACVAYRNSLPSSSYAFMDAQWVKKYDKYNDVYRYVPANGDVAGLMVRTDQTRDPWFSPAGLNRGNLKGVQGLAWNPKEAFRDVLYQNGINPIVNFVGQGAVLFGDKTMQTKASAFDRINVRRLFITIRKAIKVAAKYVIFEFNDETTRGQFTALIDPFLRDVQGRRGLTAYKVVCDASNNSPQTIDTDGFNGDIYISANRSINFVNLNFIATRTNVNFSEIVGKF